MTASIKTPEQDSGANPSVEPITAENQTTAERIQTNNLKDAAVDVEAFDAAVEAVVMFFPTVFQTEREAVASKVRLAGLIMDVRQSVTLPNGEPDTYGTSNTYRVLFQDSIVGPIVRAHPSLEVSWVKTTLATVRKNYLNSTSTGGRDLVSERVIRDAVESGKVAHAKLLDSADGSTVVEIQEHRKNGNPVMVKDSKTGEQVQKVTRYTVGTPDAPAVIKSVVQDAVTKRGRSKQQVPTVYGGPAASPGTGGSSDSKQVNHAKVYEKALEAMTEAGEHITLAVQAQYLHAAVTAFVDAVNKRQAGEAVAPIADALADLGSLASTEAAVLRAKDDQEREAAFGALAAFRWSPPEAVKTEGKTEADADDAAASEQDDDADADAADAAAVAADQQ